MHQLDLSQSPYFDDFDEEKKFYKILFRPGKAVQGRELTQIQSILLHQIEMFAEHIFKPGSVVKGAGTTLEVEGVKYIKIDPTFNGVEVNIDNFVGQFIEDTSGLGIRAYVIAAQEATSTTPKTLIVKYTSAAQVDDVTTIDLETEDGDSATTYATSPVVGNASICSIDEGKFFVQGLFAHVAKQTVILDAYGTTPTYKIGLELDEDVITERDDASLLDPAVGSSNYQAPGAARYQLSLVLAKRSLTSTDDARFIELLRVEDGKIVKKNKYPVYSEIEKTLARRTFDESGNYTVRPFQIAFKNHETYANAYYAILEPGKAYVFGHEFETIAPTLIKAERSREVLNVFNYNLTFDYQNYVDVTNLAGPIPFDILNPLTIHCVPKASINTTSPTLAAATRIGNVKIRALDYQSGANATSISTGVWRAYLLDANVVNRTANATGGTSNTCVLDTNASTVNDAYKGVTLRIVKHAGVNVGETQRIASYNGSTKTCTLESGATFAFGSPTSATEVSLDFEFKDTESIVIGSSNVITTGMDIDSAYKASVDEDPYQGVYIGETNFNSMIFPLPYPMIAGSSVVGGTPITNSEYTGYRLYTNQTFSANVISLTTASGFTSAVNGNPLSTSVAIENVLVVIKSPGSGTLANNQVVNLANSSNAVTVTTASNTSSYTITVPGAGNATADVYVKVSLPYSHTLGSLVKSKATRLANTGNVWSSSGTTVGTGITYYSQFAGANGAQINFLNTAISKLQTPNQPQTLYVADGIRVAGVFDFGSNTISQANLSSATDITSHYNFDSGQRDNTYDHCAISLKSNATGPTGNTVVYVDFFTHSGVGYLTPDSYISAGIAYENIPTYTSPTTGRVYNLRDVIDFRPRRNDADTVGTYGETILGVSGSNFQTDFSHYLSRIDKIVLTKDQTFEIVSGISSVTPTPPADKDNGMTLYTLSLPPYTANTRDIAVKYVDNRRYTMRDIGTLEQRISSLEYYTSLNLLEKAAKDQEILDDAGLNRFKNGILVDPFTGHNIGDVRNLDYHAAVDAQNHELRPPFTINNYTLDLNSSGSSNYTRNGAIFTIPYTEETLVDQPYASMAINVNPFNTVAFIGTIRLDPSSDVWVNTEQAPDVLVNLEGDNDAWKLITDNILQINPGRIFGTVWNSWQTTWTGISNQRTEITNPQWIGVFGGGLAPIWGQTVSRDLVDVTQRQVRTGMTTTFAPETITRSIGNKVTDVSIVPYIRSRGVLFSGQMFLANTALYPFFDGTNVHNYINRLGVITIASNNTNYIDTYQNGEELRIYEPAASRNTAFAKCVRTKIGEVSSNVTIVNIRPGDDGFYSNVRIVAANATFLIGLTSGSNTRISGYAHHSGFVSNASSNTITFQNDILSSNTNAANTNLIGETVYITSGLGAGSSGVVASYNVTTKQAVITGTFATTPNTTSTYSIGQLRTDDSGEVFGVFNIPSNDTVKFRTGERVFRLIDNSNNLLGDSATNGEVKYNAQGLLQNREETVISTRVPSIQRTSLRDERTVTSTVVEREEVIGTSIIGYYDPLAQTFFVDQRFHPSGVQVTGIRLMFKTKDPIVPVQVQLRPVVNGFPHSSLTVPGSEIVVDPSDIIEVSEATLSAEFANSSSNSAFDNADLYTQINFRAPLYLQPGAEYAIVLITNSVKYQVYASEVGTNLLGTSRLISTQPYLGSLFKSQNATAWTPVQDQDLMFRLLCANYDTSIRANLEFKIHANSAPTSNANVDVFYVTAGNLVLPNTTVESLYMTTTNSGTRETARSFQVEENTFFDDTLGNRVITSDTNSFKVRLLLTTRNEDISPVVDLDRLSVLAVQNLLNNGGLSNSSIVLLNSTNTYANANISVTISGGGGTGANAYAVVTSNAISSIVVNSPGSGYTSSPTITISGGGGSANAVVVGEDQASGGPALARYITRKVTLADGMDAGDFRVYFSAYKPRETTIDVYYKILSADDTDIFDSKGYQLMTIIQGYNNTSLNSRDIKDFVYAPGTGNVADNGVNYGTFNSFKHFAIKVVMRSSDSTKAPRIRDFRVIAIPSLS